MPNSVRVATVPANSATMSPIITQKYLHFFEMNIIASERVENQIRIATGESRLSRLRTRCRDSFCDLSMPLADEDSSDAAVGMYGSSSMVDIDKNVKRLRTHGRKRKMGATGLAYRPQRRRFHLSRRVQEERANGGRGSKCAGTGIHSSGGLGRAVSARNVVTCMQPIRIGRLVFR